MAALTAPEATDRTFERVAEQGGSVDDLNAQFAALDQDPTGSLDGARDEATMLLHEEPQRVRVDLKAVHARAAGR